MTISIDVHELAAETRRIALANPDFVYDPDSIRNGGSCMYFENGEPSCLIGHGLAALGVTQADIAPYNENTDVEHLLLEVAELDNDSMLTQKSLDLLKLMQSCQDGGDSWGEAARVAYHHVELDTKSGVYADL